MDLNKHKAQEKASVDADIRRAPEVGRLAASGAIWITLEMGFVQGLSLVVFAVLAHYLSAADFGLIAITFAFIYSLKSLAIDQIILPILRKPSASNEEYSTIFWLTSIAGLGATLALEIVSLWIDGLSHVHGLAPVLRAMAPILTVMAISRTQECWMGRHFLFRPLAVRTMFGTASGAVVGVSVAILGGGVWAIVIQQIVSITLSFLLLWFTASWKPSFTFRRSTVLETVMFYRSILGNTIFGVINQNIDTVLVTAFFGTSAVGLYSVAKRLRQALQLLAVNPISSITQPLLADAQAKHESLQTVFLTASRYVFGFCTPLFLGASTVATPAVILLFGAKWSAAASVFAWLAVGAVGQIAYDYVGFVLVLRNRSGWLSWMAGLQTLLTFLAFVAINALAGRAIAAPFVTPYLILCPLAIFLALRLLGIGFGRWARNVGPIVIAAVCMACIVHIVRGLLPPMSNVLLLGALVVIGAMSYLLLVSLLDPQTLGETLSLIRRRRAKIPV